MPRIIAITAKDRVIAMKPAYFGLGAKEFVNVDDHCIHLQAGVEHDCLGLEGEGQAELKDEQMLDLNSVPMNTI